MTEQKLKVYNFVTKIRNKETNKTIEKQFRIVVHNIKEAKELFELAFDYGPIHKNWELIEISEIKRDFSKKWNNPYYMRHCYESLTKMVKRIMEDKDNAEK